MGNDQNKPNKPVKVFRAGGVKATIWLNKHDKGDFYTVAVSRSYKDGEEWKETASMRVNDLPKLTLVSNMAYGYIVVKDEQASE